MKVLLTHTPRMREQYYGPRALAELEAMAEVILHQQEQPLTPEGLVAAAAEADLIIADRLTTGPAEIFPACPGSAPCSAAPWISATSTRRRRAGRACW
ncbi:hypothetical protein ACFQU7_32200 [Pseudoroseomonas wenyumeiae]